MEDTRRAGSAGGYSNGLQHPLPRRPPPTDLFPSTSLNRTNLTAHSSSHAPPQRQRTHSTHSTPQDPPPSYPLQPHRSTRTSLKVPLATANSSRSTSATSSSRFTKEGPFQPFPSTHSSAWTPPARSESTVKSQPRRRVLSSRRDTQVGDTASESGVSLLSAFRPTQQHAADDGAKERRRAARDHTDSPLRRWARWTEQRRSAIGSLALSLALVVLIKWCISLGSYSGALATASDAFPRSLADTPRIALLHRRQYPSTPRRLRSSTTLACPHFIVFFLLPSLACASAAIVPQLPLADELVLSRPLILGLGLPSSHRLPLPPPRNHRTSLATHRPFRHSSAAGQLDGRRDDGLGARHGGPRS